jgi:hypothetical protein
VVTIRNDGEAGSPSPEGAQGRLINERIAAHQSLGWGEKMAVFCECDDGDCQVRIELTWQDYEEAREHPSRRVVSYGHERPGAERVIRRAGTWMIVEQFREET